MKIISKIDSDKDPDLIKVKPKNHPDIGVLEFGSFAQSILNVKAHSWAKGPHGPILHLSSIPTTPASIWYKEWCKEWCKDNCETFFKSAMVLNYQFCDFYGHILPDCLPELIDAEENSDFEIVFAPQTKTQKEIIELIGLKFDKIKFIETGEEFYFKANKVNIKICSTYPEVEISKIRKLKELIEKNLSPADSAKKLIYYSRSLKDAGNGRIMSADNEKKIIDILKDYAKKSELDFCIFNGQVNGKTMPIKDQINLFRSAKMIVGPHGTGFTNVIWIDPKNNCKICEFAWGTEKPKNSVRGYSTDFKKNYNFLYSGLPDEYTDYFVIPFTSNAADQIVEIDIDNLVEFLE